MKKFKLKKDKWYFQSLRETKSVQELENWAVEISGYASTKDKDRGGDVVEPKAFASALERYMTNPIVLLQHKADKPIWIVEEANIDDNGLFIKANISQNTDGVIDLIKNGVLRAFSIGYSVKDYDTDVRELADGSYDMTNIIKDLELYEISVVSVPMNPYALSKSVEDLLEVEDHEDEDLSEEETSEEVEEAVEEKPAEVEEEKKEESEEPKAEELPNEEVETEEIVEEWNDKRDQEYVAEETADGVAVEVKEAEAENLDEKDGELDENLDEKEEEVVAEEPKEADENSEIEEAEIEESSENAVETQADEMKVDETSDGQVVETKSIEADSQKQLDFDSKIEKLSKSFEEKLSRKDEEIKSLTSKVETMTKLFAESLDTIENLMTAVKNTPVNSGLAYKKPLKKWYSSIAEGIKNFYNS